eukprot:COSAG03_NODE_12006_length_566_cov_0.843683_2_plen_31_part_01
MSIYIYERVRQRQLHLDTMVGAATPAGTNFL